MTATNDATTLDRRPQGDHALLELRNISKYFGNVTALENISTKVEAGKVTCVLGDNGAGKSTFIKILSGVHQPSSGQYTMYGTPVEFQSPRDARAAGIATVFQDLALAPLLSVWRNFFLGVEPMRFGLFMRSAFMKKTAKEEMAKMGIDVRDIDQPVGTMSGGERQSVAIARAVYFGARVLILDEPTSALGVKQSGVVLKYARAAADRGLGVIFITHNPNHAFPVGDRFLILNRGHSLGDFAKDEISHTELTRLMAGGAELEALEHEIGVR
jgi:simple sugar transport system ATP-binding protein